jgi:hypothetical protein
MNAMLAFSLPAADGKPFLLHLSGKFRLAY